LKYVFDDEKPFTPSREKVLNYALGTYKVSMESVVVVTSKRSHSIGN
jgi:hypothetical protein